MSETTEETTKETIKETTKDKIEEIKKLFKEIKDFYIIETPNEGSTDFNKLHNFDNVYYTSKDINTISTFKERIENEESLKSLESLESDKLKSLLKQEKSGGKPPKSTITACDKLNTLYEKYKAMSTKDKKQNKENIVIDMEKQLQKINVKKHSDTHKECLKLIKKVAGKNYMYITI